MRSPYNPASQQYWYGYFANNQSGGMLVGFKGARYQSGAGLGNVLASIMRFILPIAKNVGKNIVKTAVKTTTGIAEDVIVGKTFKESLKNRGRMAAGDLIDKGAKRLIKKVQTGKGVGRRKTTSKSIKGIVKLRKPKRKYKDIFG